jgi:hypothetical protein
MQKTVNYQLITNNIFMKLIKTISQDDNYFYTKEEVLNIISDIFDEELEINPDIGNIDD